jgi:predicted MFS family arabinose efflux permease
VSSWTKRLAVDIRPLRTSRDFRLLWSGYAISFLGSQLSYVAVPYQVFRLTHSSLKVGLIGLAILVPLLITSFLGGALADAFDRRTLFALSESAHTVVALGLVVNALLPHPHLWALYVLSALTGAISGIGRPSYDSLIPRIVTIEEIPAASALLALIQSLGLILGPALAGVLIAAVGLSSTYLVDALTFAASLCALALMRAAPPPEDAARPSLRSVLDGLRFLGTQPVIQGTYIVDFVAMLFGMPSALFPALAAGRFGGGPQVLGLLYAAPFAGTLLVTVTSGWTSHVRRQGRAVVFGALGWGLAITAFGLTHQLASALFFLALAGAGDMVSGLFRMNIWNSAIPDAYRGRLAGLELANVNSGPLLGDFEAGAVASWRGLGFAIVSGGLACVAAVLLTAALLPRFLSYERGT